jgi:hypothetical protein
MNRNTSYYTSKVANRVLIRPKYWRQRAGWLILHGSIHHLMPDGPKRRNGAGWGCVEEMSRETDVSL